MSKKKKPSKRRAPGPSWYHGGAPGLRPGDVIRPAAQLPQMPAQYEVDFIDYETDPHVVYLTTDRRFARAYAAKYTEPRTRVTHGDLYEVSPRGTIGPDPDYEHHPGISYTADSAVVLRVLEQRIRPTPEVLAYADRLSTWDDGTPMYDSAGYAQPSALGAAIGITADDLRHIGPNAVDVPDHLSRIGGQLLAQDAGAREAYLRWHHDNADAAGIAHAERVIAALHPLD